VDWAARAMTAPGLLLDLDGTLAESIPVLTRLYFDWLAERGAQGSDDEFAALNGAPLLDVMRAARARHGLAERPEALVRDYVARIHAVYHRVPPTPGARELVDAARARGVRVAVVTGSSSEVALRWLETHGFGAAVDVVVGGDQVERGKPDPESFLLALARLGCAVARSIAVEDAPLGTRAAIAAGLRTFVRAAPDDPRDWPPVAGRVARLDELIGELPL
jgi:HAD superfamily hydrolase (TIGR01509 family)